MDNYQEYFETNKALWNGKTPIHIGSDFYDMPSFVKGETSLRKIELDELGDISGKRVLHLQCHFGQDSISMARMGAKVTAIDLSDVAIGEAKKIATDLNVDVNFICCNVYDVDKHLDDEYDIVFTSYGTICWLPDLSLWAKQIVKRLNPSGRFIMVDFHPVINMINWSTGKIEYNYFNTKTYTEVESGTYADNNASIELKEHFWLHPISDILNALTCEGLALKTFQEYDYSPYDCFDNMKLRAPQEYVYGLISPSIPHCYKIISTKSN